ncbi:MAG: winged helix-turn-helix domain-containing protein [Chloroflexota bacterium]
MTTEARINPYSRMLVSLPPERFFGRKALINLCLQGVSAGRPVSFRVSGPRTIGKTSLVKFLADPSGAAHYHRADFLAFGGDRPQAIEWIYVDYYKVNGAQLFSHLYQRLQSDARLRSLAGAALDLPASDPVSAAAKDGVDAFCTALAARPLRLVFCLDHFDETFRSSSLEDQQFLRSLTGEHAWILITEKKLTDLRAGADDDNYWSSPLGPVLKAVRVNLLQPQEALLLPAAGAPLLPEWAGAWALQLAGGHPYLLTLVGEALYNLLGENGGARQPQPQVLDQVKHEILLSQPVTELFRMFWRQLDERKRRFLAQLAVDSGQPAGRPDMDVVTALLEECLIERSPAPQNYRIFSELFREFVQRQPAQSQPKAPDVPPGLTPLDQKLLQYFIDHPGQVCSFETLYRAIWDRPEEKRGLDAAIHRIRQALKKHDPSGWSYIRSERGVGYSYHPRPDR